MNNYNFVIQYALDGKCVYINSAAESTFGVYASDVVGNQPGAISNLKDNSAYQEALIAALNGEMDQVETVVNTCAGQRTYKIQFMPWHDADGKVEGVLVIGHDISELKKSEQKYRSIAESSPDNFIRVDHECRICYINNKLVNTLGLSNADEVIGRPIVEIWPDGRLSKIEIAIKQAMKTGKGVAVDLESISDDGSIRYYCISVVPEYDCNDQIIGAMIFGRDVTGIRENELRLQHYLDMLPGIAHTFHMSSDGHGRFPYVSKAVREIYGLKPNDVQNEMAPLHNMAHPDDRPRIDEAIAESARNLKQLHFDFRVCRSGHRERWLEVFSVPERQIDGSTLWTGVMLDITQRKQVEQQMLLFRRAVDTSTDSFFVIDDQFCFVDVNASACYSLGYSREELIGMSVLDINPDITSEALRQMDRLLNDKRQFGIFETRHRTKNGRIFPVEISSALFQNGDDSYAISVVRDITTRKQNERLMMRLQKAYDASADSIFIINDQARFVDVNATACNSLGYSRDELIGMTALEIDPNVTQDMLQHFIDDANNRQYIDPFESHHRTKDGEVFPVEIATTFFEEDGRVYSATIARDITKRKQNELEKARLQHAINASADALFLIDLEHEHKFVDVNKTACDMLGYSRDELIGMTPLDIDPDVTQEFLSQHSLTMKPGQSIVFETKHRAIDGHIFPVEIASNAFEENGHLYTIAIVRDITERKIAEDARQSALDEAKRLVRVRERFMSQMTHELRTPLNGILGYTQILMRDSTLSAERMSELEIIQQSGEHLLSLIDDVLDHAKLHEDRLELDIGTVLLDSVISKAASVAKIDADQKGLHFTYKIDNGLPGVFQGDERRIYQVLLNLLSNAIKFTEQGGVILTLEQPENGILRFLVQDTGIGIDSENQETIFQPFEQIYNAAYSAKGTGLGLAISRKLANLMGGDITFSSVLGEGSVFIFELPVIVDTASVLMPKICAEEKEGIDLDSMTVPPEVELLELLDIAQLGNMKGIVRHLESLDTRYGDFVAHLGSLANSYQSQAVLAFIKNALETV